MLKDLLSAVGAYKAYEKWLWYQIKGGTMPEHIAIILDGNRRWASERSLGFWLGHKHGAERVTQLLDWCLELGVKCVTLYSFSIQNFMRTHREVKEIFGIAEEKFREILTDERIRKNKVRVKVIGRITLLPKRLQELIREDIEGYMFDLKNPPEDIAFRIYRLMLGSTVDNNFDKVVEKYDWESIVLKKIMPLL